MPYIALIEKVYSRETYSRFSNKVSQNFKLYTVILLNKTHREKIKIGGFYKKDEALKMIQEISEKYDKESIKYSPKISEATRKRKR